MKLTNRKTVSRTLTALLALLLVFCLTVPLVACGDSQTSTDTETEAQTEKTTETEAQTEKTTETEAQTEKTTETEAKTDAETDTKAETNSGSESTSETVPESVTEVETETDAETTPDVDKSLEVKVTVLSGTTGFGMAPLMDKASRGETALNYQFQVATDASTVLPTLLNGTVDIAALPTNAAANLYAKKAGSVQVLAVNTLGVLYVMTGEGVSVSSFEDLRGKTVYCPAQNPAFIFTALCQKNGLEPGKDITIDSTTYAQPADLRTMLATGKVDIAVLPEPMVTIAKSANDKLSVALDLTKAWSEAFGESAALAQGCVVVRTEFAEQHPVEVAAFLREYEESVLYVRDNPTEAGQMIAAQNIFEKAPVATKAIPNCNLCFITGQEMADKLTSFYTTLYSVAPASIGNAIPDNGLYYGIK